MAEDNFIIITQIPEPYEEVNFRREKAGWYLDFHQHNYFQLILILSGELIVSTDTQEYKLSKGKVIIIPPEIKHSLHTKTAYYQFGINFPCKTDKRGIINILKTYIQNLSILNAHSDLDYIMTLRSNLNRLNQVNRIRYAAILDRFIINIIDNLTDDNNNNFSEKLLEFFHCKLRDNITLEDITNKLAISQTHLERLANKEFGCSAIKLFHKLKINLACKMLLDKNKSISQVAHMLGYQDTAYFCRFFKKKMKITASEYRKLDEKG